MSETPVPRPDQTRIERRAGERPSGPRKEQLDAFFDKLRETHEQYRDNDAFIKAFRQRTEEALTRLTTLMPERVNQTPPGGVPLSIMAEVEATHLAEADAQRIDAEKESKEDKLTGLPNRRGMEERMDAMEAHAHRKGEPLTYIMVDGDRFKRVNDTIGHEGGDKVLKGIADVMRANLRESDVAARWGGEEFVIALPDTNIEGAIGVVERIRTTMKPELSRILLEAGYSEEQIADLALTASFGIADASSASATREDILKQADAALYVAKQTRNRVVGPQELRATIDTQQLDLNEIARIQEEDRAAAQQPEHLPPTRWMRHPNGDDPSPYSDDPSQLDNDTSGNKTE